MNSIKNFQTINLKDLNIDQSVISLVAPAYANKYKIIPIKREKKFLTLAGPSSMLNLIKTLKINKHL